MTYFRLKHTLVIDEIGTFPQIPATFLMVE